MPVTVSVTPAQLAVEPGRSGSFAVDLAGDRQDVRLELAGTAAEWAVVAPPEVPVPGRARVVVQVPRSPAVAPGPASITVRAGGAEASATVDVQPFADVRASLSPRASRGRSGGRHVVRVENAGNRAVDAALEATTADTGLRVHLERTAVTLAPGQAVAVPVRVEPRGRRLVGRARARDFAVGVRAAGTTAVAEGLLVHERTRWPLPVAFVLVLGALGLAVRGGGGDPGPQVAVPTTLAGAVPVQAAQCPPGAVDGAGSLVVQSFLFCPIRATVAAGSELRWSNRDAAPHTVSADGDEFDTGAFGRGEERTVRFDRAGTFHYFCRLHPFMRGTVVVT